LQSYIPARMPELMDPFDFPNRRPNSFTIDVHDEEPAPTPATQKPYLAPRTLSFIILHILAGDFSNIFKSWRNQKARWNYIYSRARSKFFKEGTPDFIIVYAQWAEQQLRNDKSPFEGRGLSVDQLKIMEDFALHISFGEHISNFKYSNPNLFKYYNGKDVSGEKYAPGKSQSQRNSVTQFGGKQSFHGRSPSHSRGRSPHQKSLCGRSPVGYSREKSPPARYSCERSPCGRSYSKSRSLSQSKS
jgi:hypothetical protein